MKRDSGINFIDDKYIWSLLDKHKNSSDEDIEKVLEKAMKREKISPEDVAILLNAKSQNQLDRIYKIAGEIKKEIYGERIVVFAPLYISDFCVNNCVYCGYKKENKFARRKLTMAEIQQEVKILEKMGHKRLALEVGEDPVNCPIDYVVEAIDTIYKTQGDKKDAIRRINVNIAATTVENYKKLKDANVGTYILFQETYHKPTYEKMHPNCVKGDFEYHLNSFGRGMEGGLDDVGAGVLFGLADWKFEVIALMLHNEYLEKTKGVGFHTISFPRMKPAEGVNLTDFSNVIDDETFKKIVAVTRIAVPFTGIIMSTRETAEMRRELLKYGVTQVSAGSAVGVGSYKECEDLAEKEDHSQFKLSDDRTPLEILTELVDDGYLPSYCTACYRSGRTGDRFMELAKSGNIQNVCQPNALMTLMEYAMDYGDENLRQKVFGVLDREVNKIKSPEMRAVTIKNLERIKNGERDLFV